MRDLDTVDAELRVVSMARRLFGGGTTLLDRLLDERLELARHDKCFASAVERTA